MNHDLFFVDSYVALALVVGANIDANQFNLEELDFVIVGHVLLILDNLLDLVHLVGLGYLEVVGKHTAADLLNPLPH